MIENITKKELEMFSKEKIERLQNIKFRAVVRHLLPHVPYYKKLFTKHKINFRSIKTPSDWKLPLIKKSEYMKNVNDFIVQPDVKKLFWIHLKYLLAQHEVSDVMDLIMSPKKILKEHYSIKMIVFSGGTESGKPTPVMITGKQKQNMIQNVRLLGELLFEKIKLKKKTGMNLFPYAPHLGWHAVHHALEENADLNLCTAAGGAMRTQQLIEIAKEAKPTIICGMNSYIRNKFFPKAIEKKLKLEKELVIVNGAEKLNDEERRMMKEQATKLGVKKCHVIDLYAASETKEVLMPEYNGGFSQISPFQSIIKTVKINKPGKDVVEDWEFSDKGYATVWTIYGGGTVLMGYLVGDYVEKIDYDGYFGVKNLYNISRAKDVKTQLKVLGTVEGRIKGTKINLLNIREELLRIKEMQEIQLVIHKDKLIVNYVSKKDLKDIIKDYFKKHEVTPKIVKTTFDKIKGDSIKLKEIKRE